MNDLTVKHKLKSIFNNLNKITNNPDLFKQNMNIKDIVNGTIHLNKLFNQFIKKIVEDSNDDNIILFISEFKDLNGDKIFNNKSLPN